MKRRLSLHRRETVGPETMLAPVFVVRGSEKPARCERVTSGGTLQGADTAASVTGKGSTYLQLLETSVPKTLPSRPNLQHLKSQAKALLGELRAGVPAAVQAFIDHAPDAAGLTPDQVMSRGYRLADAQAVVARRTGFAAWPLLARHVDRLRGMEGTWAFRSLEVDGEPVPAAMLGSSQLLIDGDRFRMESPEAVYEGLFLIDVEPVPHRIDIDFHEGPEAGNRCEGLFEIEGDRFRICLGLAGSTRPQAFETSPGSGHALEELERVAHSRPPHVDGGSKPSAQPAREANAAHVASEPAADPSGFEGLLTESLIRLQGEWEPLELITSGSPMPKSYLPFGHRTQTGTETKVVFGGQTMLHARMRVNEAASPLEIDYLHLAGKGKGAISRGLLRWDGEEVVFCVAGPGMDRPTDFSSEKGSNRTLSRWKRKTASCVPSL